MNLRQNDMQNVVGWNTHTHTGTETHFTHFERCKFICAWIVKQLEHLALFLLNIWTIKCDVNAPNILLSVMKRYKLSDKLNQNVYSKVFHLVFVHFVLMRFDLNGWEERTDNQTGRQHEKFLLFVSCILFAVSTDNHQFWQVKFENSKWSSTHSILVFIYSCRSVRA